MNNNNKIPLFDPECLHKQWENHNGDIFCYSCGIPIIDEPSKLDIMEGRIQDVDYLLLEKATKERHKTFYHIGE